MKPEFKLGITKEFPCNYLPEQNERLLIAVDEQLHNQAHYNWLMHHGFRRSGDQIYRPHCLNCSQCQSIRVIVDKFKPTTSQRRLLKKNSNFEVKFSTELKPEYYPLYEKYIVETHHDGSMFPPNHEQFMSFLSCNICPVLFIELWDHDKLISVAVTDQLNDALSSVYTFYDPNYRKQGLGIYSILKQIDIAKQKQKKFLYLGYQIDDCKKMNYKNRYFPHQRLIDQSWHEINK